MSDTNDNGEEGELPRWAKWLRQQIDGINWIAKGLIVLIGTLALLWAAVPWPPSGLDCDNIGNLNGEELQACLDG